MIRLVALGLILLMLGGCAETLARFATDAADLHQATSDYVRENIAARRYVRSECRASLVRQIEALRDEGDEVGIQQVLRDSYPPLVTMDILSKTDRVSDILSTPPSCGVDLGNYRQ